jgi:hypothetical protein
MLHQRTWEACPIDCKDALGNIYGNGSQTSCPQGKTYINAQLGELVHSVVVEHVLEHEVICRNKPAWEKHGEGGIVAKWLSPQASDCVPNVEVVYDTSPRTTKRVAYGGLLLEGLRL